jgi:hypothetical protein
MYWGCAMIFPLGKSNSFGDFSRANVWHPFDFSISPENDASFHANLVGGLEHEFYDFPIILGNSSSQLTSIFFRGVGIPPTSYSWLLGLEGWWFHGQSGWLWPPSKFKKMSSGCRFCCPDLDVNIDDMFLDKPVWNTCCFMLMDYPLKKKLTVCCWTSHFLSVNQRTQRAMASIATLVIARGYIPLISHYFPL